MPKQIAVAGKGGTGKTTLASLLVRYLAEEKPDKDILAVDADANANFNEALGLEVKGCISDILEDTKDFRKVPQGMTKEMYVEMQLHHSMTETEKYDLVVMGNPHGPGCYCYPSDLLRKHLENLRDNYDYLVVDNEAGLEHLSRKILPGVDVLLVTSDATARGVRSAGRVYEIVKSVNLDVKEIYLIITKAQKEEDVENLKEEIEKTGLTLGGQIPLDNQVAEFDLKGTPLIQLPDDSPAYQSVKRLAKKLNL